MKDLGRGLFTVRFDRTGDAFWAAVYRIGRPVQYAYVQAPLALFHVQTGYASRPWAAEMPSAGRPLTWSLLLRLRQRGVGVARVTHAAGLSSTGDAALDATLPWPERLDIPPETVEAAAMTRRSGGRVLAVGTSVVRALEGAARGGELRSGEGVTDLGDRAGLRGSSRRRNLHRPARGDGEPLRAAPGVCRAPAPRAGLRARGTRGYLGHEFGDSCLIVAGVASDVRVRSHERAA